MLPSDKINELINYWITTAKDNRKTMEGLYKLKRYADSLFFGHLILEKALKALAVKESKEYAPRTHNLPLLAKLSKAGLTEEENDLLFEADLFNMEARYPDIKLKFHKKCTKAYADRYYKKIIKLFKKLCQKAR